MQTQRVKPPNRGEKTLHDMYEGLSALTVQMRHHTTTPSKWIDDALTIAERDGICVEITKIKLADGRRINWYRALARHA